MQPQAPTNIPPTAPLPPTTSQPVVSVSPPSPPTPGPNLGQPQGNSFPYSQTANMPSIIGLAAAGIGLIALAVIFGYVDAESSYLMLLIPFAISLVGIFFSFKSVQGEGGINKLSLVALILGLSVMTLSFTLTVGEGISIHRLKAAESSQSGSY
jgi:hypothetical protein